MISVVVVAQVGPCARSNMVPDTEILLYRIEERLQEEPSLASGDQSVLYDLYFMAFEYEKLYCCDSL